MSLVKLDCERGRSITFDTQTTALLCIDFQADFVAPEGRSARLGASAEQVQAVVPTAQRLLGAARFARLVVVHTRESYAPDLSDLNRFRRLNDRAIGSPGPLGRFLVRGERGTRTVEALRPMTGEIEIDKAGFSAFHGTSLDAQLRSRNVETLLLCGVTSQCCVASTLRQAVDLGYACVLVADASAAFDPLDHEATLRVIYSENHTFGWVSDAVRCVAALAGARASLPASR